VVRLRRDLVGGSWRVMVAIPESGVIREVEIEADAGAGWSGCLWDSDETVGRPAGRVGGGGADWWLESGVEPPHSKDSLVD